MKNETLLLRQVHPSWVQLNRVTSQVFRPTPKDQKRLSVYDGDQISAADSWRHFTEGLGYASVGVLAVTRSECLRLDLAVQADPTPFPEHAFIDFSGSEEGQIKKKSKQLTAAAQDRGWLHQAEPGA
ncbi:MAG: hypothetical protein ABJC13_11960 [Acidobacteriota bacterium]